MTAFAFNLVRLNQAATLLGGVRSPSFDRRDEFSPVATDGTLHQTSNAIIRSMPKISFSTIAVRALFASLTATELPFLALDGANGIEVFAAKINAAGPGYAGGSVHAKKQMISGQINLTGVKWSPGNVVEATAEVFGIAATGSTDPVTTNAAVALPTLSANTEQLVLSSLVLGGATMTKITDLDISIGHQTENNDQEICFNTGLPFPIMLKQAGVGGQTEITATVETTDFAAAPTATGTLVATFTAVSPLGIGLGSPTATIILAGCIIREESNAAGGPGKRRYTIRATFDGATRPVTVAVA
jgi:hypothetical protein